MRESCSKIASAPNELSGCDPNTSLHIRPWLVVFQIPPPAEATHKVDGSLGSISMSWMRPLVTAGPISLKCRAAYGDWPDCAVVDEMLKGLAMASAPRTATKRR